jgi:hypothetical protein
MDRHLLVIKDLEAFLTDCTHCFDFRCSLLDVGDGRRVFRRWHLALRFVFGLGLGFGVVVTDLIEVLAKVVAVCYLKLSLQLGFGFLLHFVCLRYFYLLLRVVV